MVTKLDTNFALCNIPGRVGAFDSILKKRLVCGRERVFV